MKILITAVPNGPELVRWVSGTRGCRHSFYILPSTDSLSEPFHPELEAMARSSAGRVHLVRPAPGVQRELPRRLMHRLVPGLWQALWFRWMALSLKPDIVHAIGLQRAGFQCINLVPAEAQLCLQPSRGELSSLCASDDHSRRVRRLVERAAFYILDAAQEAPVLQRLGFRGISLGPVLTPISIDVERVRAERASAPSASRTIAIRDAGPSARTHMVLDALLPIRELASRFEIVVYSASEEIRLHAHVLRRDHGLRIETIAPGVPQAAVRELLGRARVAVAVAIPGGAGSDLLEAMIAGALPVHDASATANEFVFDGISALIVDPHRPASVTAALERSLTDDAFVNSAAERNLQTCLTRLDRRTQSVDVQSTYERMQAALRGRPPRIPAASRIASEPHT